MGKVLLYSGGMDSFCLLEKVKPDCCVLFRTGTEANHREVEASICYLTAKGVAFHVHEVPLEAFTLTNHITPHRNSIFALLASKYGNEIYMGACAADAAKDKDAVWKSQVEGMLNYFEPEHGPFAVHLPYMQLTKTKILTDFLFEPGRSVEDLRNHSRSCYFDTDLECGRCMSCLRKAIAFAICGLYDIAMFEADPLQSAGPRMIQTLKDRSMQEYEDFNQACNILDNG